jgi:hypothetical protein
VPFSLKESTFNLSDNIMPSSATKNNRNLCLAIFDLKDVILSESQNKTKNADGSITINFFDLLDERTIVEANCIFSADKIVFTYAKNEPNKNTTSWEATFTKTTASIKHDVKHATSHPVNVHLQLANTKANEDEAEGSNKINDTLGDFITAFNSIAPLERMVNQRAIQQVHTFFHTNKLMHKEVVGIVQSYMGLN